MTAEPVNPDGRVPDTAPGAELADELARIEALPLAERAAAYGELHERLGRALDGDD